MILTKVFSPQQIMRCAEEVQPWTGNQDRGLHRVHGESLQHLHCGWLYIYIILLNDQ